MKDFAGCGDIISCSAQDFSVPAEASFGRLCLASEQGGRNIVPRECLLQRENKRHLLFRKCLLLLAWDLPRCFPLTEQEVLQGQPAALALSFEKLEQLPLPQYLPDCLLPQPSALPQLSSPISSPASSWPVLPPARCQS